MANTIKHIRSAVPGKVPTTTDLQLGVLGLNTYDGKVFLKKSVSGVESIVEVGAGGSGTAGPIPQYDQQITENVTLTSGYNGFSFTSVEVASGYTVEVPAGQSWAILNESAGTSSGSATLTETGITPGIYRSLTIDAYGRATAGSNPTTLAGYGISDTSANLAAAISDETGTGSLVFANSPALTGTPTTPTAATATNNSQIASTAFVRNAITDYAASGITYNGTLSTTSAPSNALASNTTGSNATAYGAFSLSSNTTGVNNTAIGQNSLRNNTTGQSNTAIGRSSLLSNISGNYNTALGEQALSLNTIGNNNTCVGHAAGWKIEGISGNSTAGCNNVAIGYYAMLNTTTGERNVAIGEAALQNNTTGYWNTSIGGRSGIQISTGNQNTAVGFESLFYATTTNYQTALGFRALHQANNNSNVGIGSESGYYITSGYNNICIGTQAGTDAVANLTTQANYVVLGNNNTANANIKVSWTVTSDARDKCNISPCTSGLALVSSLKPVCYQYRQSRNSDQPATDARPRYGFLAQDILELEGNNPVIIDNRDPDSLKFNEASLIPVLVNAIQELSAQVSALTTRVQALEAI